MPSPPPPFPPRDIDCSAITPLYLEASCANGVTLGEASPAVVRFPNVGTVKEEGAADLPFDLLLTVTEGNAYYGCNGGATDEDGTLVTYGRYGSISVHGGSTAKVTVELVDPTTGDKVIVPNFYLSFYDLDGDGDSDAYKSIELADYESVTLSSPTNVVVDDAGTTFRACGVATDCGTAIPYADGLAEDLPTEPSSASPLELTAEQLARTATFMFADVSTLTFVLRTGTAQGGDPLSFLFGGASALVAACDAPPPPPPVPPPSPPPSPPPPQSPPSSPPIPPPSPPLPPHAPFSDCADRVTLGFDGACGDPDRFSYRASGAAGGTVVASGNELLEYKGIGEYEGKVLDMIVRTAAAYALPAWHEDGNGCAAGGGLGSLAVGPGQSQSFELELIDAATGQPAVLPEFFISFFDIDGDGDAVEHVSVSGYSAVVCHEDAYVITQVANTADVYSCMADDFTCAAGDAPDPTDPTMLSEDQVKRTVTFMFNGKSTVDVTLTAGPAGADFLFGFASPLVPTCPPAPPSAPPPPAPPPGAPSMVDCSNNIQLNFEAVCAEGYAFYSNLAGAGPDGKWLGAKEELRFRPIAIVDGRRVDLVVTSMVWGDAAIVGGGESGCSGAVRPVGGVARKDSSKWGRITVKAGETARLAFALHDADTDERVPVSGTERAAAGGPSDDLEYYFSILDVDGDAGAEAIAVTGAYGYALSTPSNLIHSEKSEGGNEWDVFTSCATSDAAAEAEQCKVPATCPRTLVNDGITDYTPCPAEGEGAAYERPVQRSQPQRRENGARGDVLVQGDEFVRGRLHLQPRRRDGGRQCRVHLHARR